MKKLTQVFTALASPVLFGVVGCDRSTTISTGYAQPTENKTNIHIRTPKTQVDIEGKGEGKGVNVDVEKSNR